MVLKASKTAQSQINHTKCAGVYLYNKLFCKENILIIP